MAITRTSSPSPPPDCLFGTDCFWLKTGQWIHAFQGSFLRSTLMFFNLVKTHQSMGFQYLLVQSLITITGDGCVHIVAKIISRGEES